MAQQPPEPLRPAAVPVGHDLAALPDGGTPRGGGKALRRRQRMAPGVRHGKVRKGGVDVEERRARDVAGEVGLAASRGIPELPTTVDKLVPHVPTSVDRRSSHTTSRQTPPASPMRSRTPTSRKPHVLWRRIDASFSGKTPAVSVQ